MKTILVTGGLGFIGYNLCKLLCQDNKVIILDNLYCTNNNAKNLNIEALVIGDVNQDHKNLHKYKFDEIYHLACPASPKTYQKDPNFTLDTCYIGTKNMIELAKKNNAKLLFSSTSEVYGNPLVHPQTESYWGNVNCDGIRSCYDEGKRIAETLFINSGINYKIIRIFNTYGPFMDIDDGRVVSNFICQALQSKDITIYGDGSQTRSFQYIYDLLMGMTMMMNSEYHGPVNIGNPGEYTVKELAEKIIQMTNSNSKIIYEELPSDDPVKRKPDITLAKNTLGWSPKFSLDTGLKYTIEYFKNVLESSSSK